MAKNCMEHDENDIAEILLKQISKSSERKRIREPTIKLLGIRK